jgi:UDP-arabinose 4-epimerase
MRIPILVTGGAGYIGSHACKALWNAGFAPLALDDLSLGHEWAVKWGPLLNARLQDTETVACLLKEYRPKAILHFAASALVGESTRDPRKYFHNNVVNTLNLLNLAVDHGIGHFIVSSTCAVYGNAIRIPIAETEHRAPVNPYGESKLAVENAVCAYGQAYGIQSVALRYFNAAGADLDREIGEDHDPETHLIPSVIQAALNSRPHVSIFGTDYDTADGTAVRDYTHVADLADAHVLALRYLLRGGASTAVNLGSGTGYSVRQVISAVERISGREVPTKECPRRLGDPPTLIADPGKAAVVLDWSPRRSDLDTIVASAWNWHLGRHLESGVAAA